MKKLKTTVALVMLISLFSLNVKAQVKQADLAKTWETVTNMFVTTAKSMPADKYNWKPTEGIASFGALVGHTAGANYLYGPTVDGPKVPRPSFDDTKKAEVISTLEGSFKYVKDAIAKLDDADLAEEIDWFGSKMPRLKAILGMLDHVQREYGKVITYARLQGVQPAGGRGW